MSLQSEDGEDLEERAGPVGKRDRHRGAEVAGALLPPSPPPTFFSYDDDEERQRKSSRAGSLASTRKRVTLAGLSWIERARTSRP